MQILLIDNYDSFTFNLYQFLAEIHNTLPTVIHNDSTDYETITKAGFDCIIISPGPGRPDHPGDFGICKEIIKSSELPILGVCLGHQGIGLEFGAELQYAPEIMHGRLSTIYHSKDPLFTGIPEEFTVVRYHSLILKKELPEVLSCIAHTKENDVMAIRHKTRPLWGVQFHPESIRTQYGKTLLANFLNIAQEYKRPTSQQQTNTIKSIIQTSVNSKKKDSSERILKLHYRALNYYHDPEKVFMTLYHNNPDAVWLDSSRVIEGFSQFSYMGASGGPYFESISYDISSGGLIINRGDDNIFRKQSIFDYLENALKLRAIDPPEPELEFDFMCGYAGYFGYEMKSECEHTFHHEASTPDAYFVFLDRVIAFDHKNKTMMLLCVTTEDTKDDADTWFNTIEERFENLYFLGDAKVEVYNKNIFSPQQTKQTYLNNINKCLDEIHEGESYEICLTNKFSANITINPLAYYRLLRKKNPAPYGAFMRCGITTICSASPERFLKISAQGQVESKPMKGTIHRSKDPIEDEKLALSLSEDEKTQAENLMICDLIRNDLGKVCKPGSVHVPELMKVETYETVHQMISSVKGTLTDNNTPLDCIRAAFPGGSMTGAPKKRTIEIIDNLEQQARGIYSGILGYLSLNNSADFNIVIRTAIINPGNISIGTGGAIVSLSDPEEEYNEILLKMTPLKKILHQPT